MDQVKFVEDSLQKILLGLFLNTLTHMFISIESKITVNTMKMISA